MLSPRRRRGSAAAPGRRGRRRHGGLPFFDFPRRSFSLFSFLSLVRRSFPLLFALASCARREKEREIEPFFSLGRKLAERKEGDLESPAPLGGRSMLSPQLERTMMKAARPATPCFTLSFLPAASVGVGDGS